MRPRAKRVLLVARSEPMTKAIRDYLAAPDLALVEARSTAEAIEILSGAALDGIVLDWVVSEVSGVEFIEEHPESSAALGAARDHPGSAGDRSASRALSSRLARAKRRGLRCLHGAPVGRNRAA